MPALISEQFRIHNAQQFEEAFSEAVATNMYFFMGRPQNWDTSAVAGATSYVGQATGSQHSNSYLATPDENNPPTPIDSFNYEKEIFDDMISLKRITSSDVRLVIPRHNWTSGRHYSMYDHTETMTNLLAERTGQTISTGTGTLYPMYVMNSNFNVYKCLFNNKTEAGVPQPSTTEPTATTTTAGAPAALADGYVEVYVLRVCI